jgi:hypothetical protein
MRSISITASVCGLCVLLSQSALAAQSTPPSSADDLKRLFSAIENDLCNPSIAYRSTWKWSSITHSTGLVDRRDGKIYHQGLKLMDQPWEGSGELAVKAVDGGWRVDISVHQATERFRKAYGGPAGSGGTVFGTPDGQLSLAATGGATLRRSSNMDKYWDFPTLLPRWNALYRTELEYPWPSARLKPELKDHYEFDQPAIHTLGDSEVKVVLRMRLISLEKRVLGETRREFYLHKNFGYRPTRVEVSGDKTLVSRALWEWQRDGDAWLPSRVEMTSFGQAPGGELLPNNTWSIELIPGSLVRGPNVVKLEDVQPSPEIAAAVLGQAQRDSSGRSGTGETVMDRISDNRWFLIFAVSVLCVALLLVVRMAMAKRARLMHTK